MTESEIFEQFLKGNFRKSHEVVAGPIRFGGSNEVVLQSMTNTNTLDAGKTTEQSIRIIKAGGQLVRMSTPALRDVHALAETSRILKEHGYDNPICADVHFNPNVAELAAGLIEKVRINPGNYIDKAGSATSNIDDQKLEKLQSLVRICKKNKTALRIGTNHGSLSTRIVEKYGDTPEGMVQSVLEFLQPCSDLGFDQIVISLKSSNTRVMVHANRLLASRLEGSGFTNPLHLGVTEAGDAEEGRVKSAIGIASLLLDGIGDTIRVSLTEDPELEIPVARKIKELTSEIRTHFIPCKRIPQGWSPFEFRRRESAWKLPGSENHPLVISACNSENSDLKADYCLVQEKNKRFKLQSSFENKSYMVYPPSLLKNERNTGKDFGVLLNEDDLQGDLPDFSKVNIRFIIVRMMQPGRYYLLRNFLFKLIEEKINIQLIPWFEYTNDDPEDYLLKASIELGPLFIDGLPDGLCISNSVLNDDSKDIGLMYNILQASRSRMSKTEFISCPSCGRTLFDLQETTRLIKEKTGHLKGLKIGIMGCIVNGPGEMADADYGYVGSGPGRISLYKSKELIEKNIPQKLAPDRLLELIKLNNDWKEPM